MTQMLLLQIRHRLMTAGQIDDGKPAKTEAERTVDEVAFIVRSTMRDGTRHPDDRLSLDRFASLEVKLAAMPHIVY